MSQKQKLVERFISHPTDFTYEELRRLLHYFGYNEDASAQGSRVNFFNDELKDVIKIHKPHPENNVKGYVLKLVHEKLIERDLL